MKIMDGMFLSVVLSASLGLSGCSKVSTEQKLIDYKESVSEYLSSPSEEALNNLGEAYKKAHDPYYFDKNNFMHGDTEADLEKRAELWAKVIGLTQLDIIYEKDWDSLIHLNDLGMGLTKEAEDNIWISYQGKNPVLLKALGNAAYRHGEPYQAYKAYEAAGLQDHNFAYLPRSLAHHYGCSDLFEVWGEVTDFLYPFKKTSSLPMQASTLSHKELIEARVKLRKGIPPELGENCPINI